MGFQRAEEKRNLGRFRLPQEGRYRWLHDQIPEVMHGMFGCREGDNMPEVITEEIQYVYEVEVPDGEGYPSYQPVLVHYLEPGDPVVAFILDDEIELDNLKFIVRKATSEQIPGRYGIPPYTLWTVVVELPEKEKTA